MGDDLGVEAAVVPFVAAYGPLGRQGGRDLGAIFQEREIAKPKSDFHYFWRFELMASG